MRRLRSRILRLGLGLLLPGRHIHFAYIEVALVRAPVPGDFSPESPGKPRPLTRLITGLTSGLVERNRRNHARSDVARDLLSVSSFTL